MLVRLRRGAPSRRPVRPAETGEESLSRPTYRGQRRPSAIGGLVQHPLQEKSLSTPSSSRGNYVMVMVIAAATVALAATGSLALKLPAWAMFIGWIAFFTQVEGTRTALGNLSRARV